MASNKFDAAVSFVQAGFPGLWVLGHEPEQAQAALVEKLKSSNCTFTACSWDCARGLVELESQAKGPATPEERRRQLSPDYPLTRDVAAHRNAEDRRLVFLHNFHRFLDTPVVVQVLYNALVEGESIGTHYVVLSPILRMPAELEKAFTVFEFPLPTPADIADTARQLLDGAGFDLPVVDPAVVEAARGLTRRELRNVLSLSLYDHERLDPKVVWGLKAEAVEKGGVLQLLKNSDTFGKLGGLDAGKAAVKKLCAYRPEVGRHAKGVLLLGPSGTGKSSFARACGVEVGRPVLRMDVGGLMNKLVGQSEENLRAAIQIAEAVAPCVLMLDEIEKALAGASGDGDSGVMRRMLGHLLTWLSERESAVFVVATSNDVSKLPPELLRAGRWSMQMFLDLPTPEERAAIWPLYLKRYSLTTSRDEMPDDHEWTGAEIEACCELAAQFQIPLKDAAKMGLSTARSSKSTVAALREYASASGVFSASTGEPYRLPSSPTVAAAETKTRKVGTKPQLNKE